MIKFNEIEILKLLYIIIAYFVIREFDNYQLILVLLFLPYLSSSILAYKKFENITRSKSYVMLSKGNFDFWNIGFAGLIAVFCLSQLNIYTGILFFSTLIYLFFEYTVSKRRIISINESGIDELGKNKYRELKEITSFNIYPNNVEIRFNKSEILQINKNELVHPNWEDFVERIAYIKTYANLDS